MELSQDEARGRFDRLIGFLSEDPGNARLALECAEAALAADLPQEALEVLKRLPELDEGAANLAGIASMRTGDQLAAQAHFERLLQDRPGDPALIFNLAWSRALAGNPEGARNALDDSTIESLPQAAMLDLQLDHELGEFERAADKLPRYLERHGEYAPLQAAASVLALDLGNIGLAQACASRAAGHPDGMTTLGTLDLADNRLEAAGARFERSLEIRDNNPRAHVGLGLTKLARGQTTEAIEHLDLGAAQFGDHLGSWIAAGWAHYLAGDAAGARSRFETALSLDDTFAEAHGSLAALDALEGDLISAERRVELARRLDRASFSAALAGVLLATAAGDPDQARRIFDTAASQPLTADGKTLLQALAQLSL